MAIQRIRPAELADVNEVLFGEGRITGPILAGRLGVKGVTFWSYLNRTGLPLEIARALRDALRAQAASLTSAADRLDRLLAPEPPPQ